MHQFLRGLKREIQVHTRTQQPRTLEAAMQIADEADKALYNTGRVPQSGGHSGGGSKGSGAAPMQLGAISLSPEDLARAKREGLCFKCMKPGHAIAECRSGGGGGTGRGNSKRGRGGRRGGRGRQGN